MKRKVGRPQIGEKKKARIVAFKVDEDEYSSIEHCSRIKGDKPSTFVRNTVMRSVKRIIKEL